MQHPLTLGHVKVVRLQVKGGPTLVVVAWAATLWGERRERINSKKVVSDLLLLNMMRVLGDGVTMQLWVGDWDLGLRNRPMSRGTQKELYNI